MPESFASAHRVELDHTEDLIVSLEQAVLQISRLKNDLKNWKWATIALHSAVQGCLVWVLTGDGVLGAYDQKQEEKFVEWRQKQEINSEIQDHSLAPYPTKLAHFYELIARIKCKDRMDAVNGQPISLSDTENKAIKWLNCRRNEFVHFKALTLTASESSFIEAAENSHAVLHKVLISYRPTTVYMNSDQENRVQDCIELLGILLGQLRRRLMRKQEEQEIEEAVVPQITD